MITDIEGNPLSVINDIIPDNGGTRTYRVKLGCSSDYKLWAEPAPDVTIDGQKVGDTGWTSLVYPGIDLSPFDGTLQLFDIRVTAADITGVVREESFVWVAP